MHRTALLFSVICMILAAAASFTFATRAVDYIEDETESQIQTALLAAGQDWATIRPDGLQVNLTGLAPDEVSRFRALEIMGQVVDTKRIHDRTKVLQSSEIVVPRFTLEALRNLDRVSLIGLIPERQGRTKILERAQSIVGEGTVTDMLESAEYKIPAGWKENLDFGLDSLAQLPLSKISITPERVKVTAATESVDEQKRLEKMLKANKPDNTQLVLDITAPRPVISPFHMRLTLKNGKAELASCSADTRDTKNRILRAARKVGVKPDATCDIGLGVPTTDWAKAVVMSIEALKELGGGTLTFTDSDIAMIAVDDTTQARFDKVVAKLENNLPDLFSLHAVLPPKVLVDGNNAPSESPEFTATRSPEGLVQLRGRVQNSRSKNSITAFASALFGRKAVENQTRIDRNLPDGWPKRVLAGLEGLAQLHHGSVIVQPDRVEISGTGASPDVEAEISRLFSVRIGGKESYKIDVKFDEKLVPVERELSGAECSRQINAVLTEHQIVFAPSSTTIEAGSQGVIDAIAEIIRDCPDAKFEVEGHTDSQGSEGTNKRLSQIRAEAVVDALLKRRVSVSGLTAKGYGEEKPIADNKTEEGRAKNRRIAFKLIEKEEETDGQN